MGTVLDLLAKKGRRVYMVAPDESVHKATRTMNRYQVGALVVTTGGEEMRGLSDQVVGIFTERDVLTRIVAENRNPERVAVGEVMTANVHYCGLETRLEEVAANMRWHRVRHMPVCDEGGKLRGMVSIGDLNAWFAEEWERENQFLHEYIHGRV